jgi:hypothetical protein
MSCGNIFSLFVRLELKIRVVGIKPTTTDVGNNSFVIVYIFTTKAANGRFFKCTYIHLRNETGRCNKIKQIQG